MSDIWKWLTTLDWGNVPAWVGSILTSVSVFLAINILRGDRKKVKRADADSFATYPSVHTVGISKTNKMMFVRFYNGGTRPFTFAQVNYRRGGQWQRVIATGKDVGINIAPPGASVTAESPLVENVDLNDYYISFTDPSSMVWFRSVIDNRYLSKRQVEKMRASKIN